MVKISRKFLLGISTLLPTALWFSLAIILLSNGNLVGGIVVIGIGILYFIVQCNAKYQVKTTFRDREGHHHYIHSVNLKESYWRLPWNQSLDWEMKQNHEKGANF